MDTHGVSFAKPEMVDHQSLLLALGDNQRSNPLVQIPLLKHEQKIICLELRYSHGSLTVLQAILTTLSIRLLKSLH